MRDSVEPNWLSIGYGRIAALSTIGLAATLALALALSLIWRLFE